MHVLEVLAFYYILYESCDQFESGLKDVRVSFDNLVHYFQIYFSKI